MDLNKTKTGVVGELWTNEKHVNYLNMIEASFVRKMLEKDAASSMPTYTTSVHHAPLDRYLPDSFESTCDSSSQTNRYKEKKDNKSCTAKDGRNNNNNNEKRMRRRCSSRPYGATQDQVVPQIGSSKSDKDGEKNRNNP